MAIRITKRHPHLMGEVEGVDLSKPVDAETVAEIEAGMDEHAVLLFRDQPLSDEQQVAFSRNFGELQIATASNVTALSDRRLGLDLADVSNLDRQGRIFARDDRRRLFGLGNRLWHSDASFRAVPAKYSLLSARSVPAQGGNTEFADMRAAYDALPAETKAEIEDLVAEHSIMYSRALLGFTEYSDEERESFAPVRQSLVRRHPVTGRTSLYLSSHAGTILGWPMPEARGFLFDLMEHATRPEFVHVHEWRVNDFIIWDNRQVMHRVRRFAETEVERDMRRTTIRGDGPTAEQAAA